MKPLKVGLIGWGTIGTGVAKILLEDQELVKRRLGWPLRLARIADLDLDRPRPIQVDRGLLTTEAGQVLNDPEIEIVIELVGGYEPARTFILEAIQAGKHVVTANKALLATHGREIFEAAAAAGLDVLFEASVGGGIPVIRGFKEGLAANRINGFFGILNGTSNYILTKMTKEGMDFHQALAEAQDKGFAEADPTFDVEGVDAAHKLVILTALAYGLMVSLDQIHVEGISRLDPLDIRFADEFGYVVKLLAISHREGDLVEARLHPAMLPKDHLLSEVNGPFNAVHVNGDAVGDILFYGAGAGMMPTASAVVSDVMELARNIRCGAANRVPALGWSEPLDQRFTLRPMEDIRTCYYFRFSALDRPGVLSKISGILGRHGISIKAVIQKGREMAGAVPIVMLTHEAREADVRAALTEMDRLDVLRDRTVVIRVEDKL
ncbi:MAG: homoserine dehydrogenase [Thermodesulfobacteriota bacterium]